MIAVICFTILMLKLKDDESKFLSSGLIFVGAIEVIFECGVAFMLLSGDKP